MKTTHEFTIKSFAGGQGDKRGNFSFETSEEAIEAAKEFKDNPRSHNPRMTDENVKYWQEQTYIISETIVITDEVARI